MLRHNTILNGLEFSPMLFSVAHFWGGGTDINRRVFVNLVQPGSVVIEVGANVGSYTTLFSRLVGKHGKVYAFEPVKANFERLCSALNSLGAQNVCVHRKGLGNTEDDREIIVPGCDFQQASFAIHKHGSWSSTSQFQRERVGVTSIDAYVSEARLHNVNFIKVDVEGAEMEVLEGGRDFLTRSKPVLHLEINPNWLRDYGTTPDDVIKFLESLGYGWFYQVDGRFFSGYRVLNTLEEATLKSGLMTGDFVFAAVPLKR